MNQIKAFFGSSFSRPMQTTDLAPASTQQVVLPTPEKPSDLRGSSSFSRKQGAIILLISIGILIPCFWLPKIEAGDLPSHTYNAWLASLVQKGQAPGLWIAPQHNNVLADILLLRLGTLFGFTTAEKIVTALAVLLFFWGAFALATVLSGKPPWFLAPLIAMLAYGWTFHMGFLNFYFSLGISFVGLALLGQPNRRLYPIVLLLAPFIWLAHPLGFVWFAATAIYILAANSLPTRVHPLLFLAGLVAMLVVHLYFSRSYDVRWWQGHFYDLNGSDQLVLGTRYPFIAYSVLAAVAAFSVFHSVQSLRKPSPDTNYFPPALQLFLIGLLALPFLPEKIFLSQYPDPVSFICSRFTLAIAILGCCALARLRPHLIFSAVLACISAAFFVLVYQDASRTYGMEQQADLLVAKLPQDARVITTIFPFRDSRIFTHHVMDRACIAHCFNIENYEASSKQFRLRATPKNRFVETAPLNAAHMMIGDYVVQNEDLPLWQIFQCGPAETDLCLRPIHAGPLTNFIPSEAVRARPLR
jgi:hypothetical protein